MSLISNSKVFAKLQNSPFCTRCYCFIKSAAFFRPFQRMWKQKNTVRKCCRLNSAGLFFRYIASQNILIGIVLLMIRWNMSWKTWLLYLCKRKFWNNFCFSWTNFHTDEREETILFDEKDKWVRKSWNLSLKLNWKWDLKF